jgi:hypothetical protein
MEPTQVAHAVTQNPTVSVKKEGGDDLLFIVAEQHQSSVWAFLIN